MAKTRRIARRVIGPPKHVLLAGKNIAKESLNTFKNVLSRTVNGVVRMGNTTAKHMNQGASNVFGKNQNKTRRARKARK